MTNINYQIKASQSLCLAASIMLSLGMTEISSFMDELKNPADGTYRALCFQLACPKEKKYKSPATRRNIFLFLRGLFIQYFFKCSFILVRNSTAAVRWMKKGFSPFVFQYCGSMKFSLSKLNVCKSFESQCYASKNRYTRNHIEH